MNSRGRWWRRLVGVLAASGVLGGALGCEESSPEPGGGGPVARLEITPRGLLLTAAGQERRLSVRAYDAKGRVVPAPSLSWRASSPANIAVDGDGNVVAQVANGASQIFAESEGVTSPPLLVAVTALPPGTLALTDAKIVGEPRATDPNAAPEVGATYEVVLTDVDPPAPGTLVVSTEAQPVGGKVVAAERDGDQVRVTLAVVPVQELFPSLSIAEQIDLSNVEPEVPADLKDTYEITRDGDTIRFSPSSSMGSSSGSLSQALKYPGKLPPFDDCEVDATGVSQLPLTLSQAPALSISQRFGLDFVYTSGVGLERLVAKGEFGAAYDGTLTVAAAFQGTVSCTKELAVIRIPIAGALSWVVSGVVPISVGFELGGKLTLASVEVGAKAEAKAKAEFGVACPGGADCSFVRGVTASTSAEPIWKKPTANDLRVDASLAVFGKAEVGIGNPIFPQVRFSAVSARSGPTLEGSFAPWTSQILDPGYASSYGLSLVTKAGVGVDLPKVLARFGLTDITIVELKGETELAVSPKGTWTADRSSFVAGDTVNFQVELDPATVEFPPKLGLYNVKDIILVRKVGTSSIVEAGRAAASAGQTSFTIPFTATDSGQTSDFSAFLTTALLPFDNLALELENGASPSCVVTDLGTLGGDCVANALNNNGLVVGQCTAGSGKWDHAFLWDNGTMQDLGTFGGLVSQAHGINDAKDVVGLAAVSDSSYRAFLWRDGVMKNLGTLGGSASSAYAINQTGHITGQSLHAFLWVDGTVTDLGSLHDISVGYALNDADQVVGFTTVPPPQPGTSPASHACLMSSSGIQDLGTGGGNLSVARGINAAGLVVGWVINSAAGTRRAAHWSSGSVTVLPGGDESRAYGVNDSGVIVGESAGLAVRWKDGKLEDLNALPTTGSGLTLTSARAINKKGQIVGAATSGSAKRAFLLSCGP